MVKEFIFPQVEENEEQEEAQLNDIPMEKKDTNIENVLIEKKMEQKHTLLKHKNMWKQKQQKEEGTS